MSRSRPSAEAFTTRRRRARGFTLIELITSQTIVLILIAGVFSLIAGMVRSYHAHDGAVEAQVRLREASHVLLRDLQAIGGEEGRAGSLVSVQDGGGLASDQLSLFKSQPYLCLNMAVSGTPGVNLLVDASAGCPFAGENPACQASMLEDADVLIVGETGTIALTVTDVDVASCRLQFNAANNGARLGEYNAVHGTSYGNVNAALNAMGHASVRIAQRFGYRVRNGNFERRINEGQWTVVVPGIIDLELAEAHDLDHDGQVGPDEWTGKSLAVPDRAALVGADPSTFLGVEFVLLADAAAPVGIGGEKPLALFNRDLEALAPERTYRWARFFAAARNRGN